MLRERHGTFFVMTEWLLPVNLNGETRGELGCHDDFHHKIEGLGEKTRAL
jgi:hypothetical protein